MGSRYAALEERFGRIARIEGALAILDWDTAVIMPKGSVESRGEQLAALKRVAHDLLTAPEVGDHLEAAATEAGLDGWQQANLREMTRQYRAASSLEPALVEAMSKATTTCEMIWRDARARSDFQALLPSLTEVIRLVREVAGINGQVLGLAPYDALLDQYQPDLRDSYVAPVLNGLAASLPPMVEAALGRRQEPALPKGPFPAATQKAMGQRIIGRIGFDFDRGRLDESTHPFSGGTPDDTRITTRYREDDVTSALMGILHETGHALYEAGLPKEWRGQPVGSSRGMAIHESQSLLMEMQACRAPGFLTFLAGELRTSFGDDPAFDPANLVRTYHRVDRGLIRVDADEITYPLHIILRWRLERAMLSGDLPLADLPAAWNDGMQELLGITPPNDGLGCMQDIHWPIGAIGYFPCYTLGAVLAAQLFTSVREAEPGIEEALAAGDFSHLLAWLRRSIHGQGSHLRYEELIRHATGQPLSVEPFLMHLRRRYLS